METKPDTFSIKAAELNRLSQIAHVTFIMTSDLIMIAGLCVRRNVSKREKKLIISLTIAPVSLSNSFGPQFVLISVNKTLRIISINHKQKGIEAEREEERSHFLCFVVAFALWDGTDVCLSLGLHLLVNKKLK